MKNFILAFILLFGPIVTQMNASEFKMLHGHRQGNGVGLMWVINSQNVSSFEILKSYDGEYYDPAGEVRSNGSSHYRFADNNVYPGYIHYVIRVIYDDGSDEYSDATTVRIVSRK